MLYRNTARSRLWDGKSHGINAARARAHRTSVVSCVCTNGQMMWRRFWSFESDSTVSNWVLFIPLPCCTHGIVTKVNNVRTYFHVRTYVFGIPFAFETVSSVRTSTIYLHARDDAVCGRSIWNGLLLNDNQLIVCGLCASRRAHNLKYNKPHTHTTHFSKHTHVCVCAIIAPIVRCARTYRSQYCIHGSTVVQECRYKDVFVVYSISISFWIGYDFVYLKSLNKSDIWKHSSVAKWLNHV